MDRISIFLAKENEHVQFYSDSAKSLTDNQIRYFEHIQAAERAGQTLKAYAAEHELSLSVLYSYKAQLKKPGHIPDTQASFSRVDVTPVSTSAPLRIRLANGILVEAPVGASTDALLRVCPGLSRLS